MSLKTKSIAAIVVVFVLWTVLDYLIHGVILASTYAETAHLWRPMAEIKRGLMSVVTLIGSAAFVGVYACLISPRTMSRALRYALLYGIGVGVPMGYGSYSVMPIPYSLALTWFLGTLVEMLAAGAVLGLMLRTEEQGRALV